MIALVVAAAGVAWAHAALLSSEPKANGTLAASPSRVRLVFSEELEPTLGRISLEGADGRAVPLRAAGDPHDVHALVAPIDSALAPGAYRVVWRVVSADGHPVKGSFVFHVAPSAGSAGSAAAHVPAPPPPDVSTLPGGGAAPSAGPSLGAAPLAASALRGLGLGALMALGGLLFFMVGDRGREPPGRARRAAAWLSVAAPVLLAAHALAWTVHTSPTQSLDAGWVRATLDTLGGRVELARVVLALLACLALLLARRAGLALALAAAALVVSGAVGHSAALHPTWAVPAKAVHLLAGAVWAGGIVWLLALDRGDATTASSFAARAERVSSAALVAVIAVLISGVVQTALFLERPLDLVQSLYGAVVLAKVAGLVALAGFGAYYRRRVMARLGDADVRTTFGGLLGRELAIMTVVVLLGGLLAYLAPPTHMTMPMASAADSTTLSARR